MGWREAAVGVAAIVTACLLNGCSAVDILNALTPHHSYQITEGIAYGRDPRQRLDVYRPTPFAAGQPLVVFFYGGSWNRGSRKDYVFLGEALASRGVITVVADYRLYPQVRYPDFLTDSAAAVAWALRAAPDYGADSKRLYVMGHSAGAYNAAMIALDARWLAAEGLSAASLAGWIGLAGPFDFLPIVNPEVRPVFNYPDSPPDSQPIAHVSAFAPRTFLGAASKDSLVDPQRNTQQMADKLRAAGVAVTLRFYPWASHITLASAFARPLRGIASVLDDVDGFVHGGGAPFLRIKGTDYGNYKNEPDGHPGR